MKKTVIFLIFLINLLKKKKKCHNIYRSSFINEVCYNENTYELDLKLNYRWYTYYGVPLYVYQELMSSNSMGSYFNRNIKGRYWIFWINSIYE